MKKQLIISICVCVVILSSLSLLFLDDKNNPFFIDSQSSKEIVNQLEKNDIQAFVILTRDGEWENAKSASITKLFFVNEKLAPKIELKYNAENLNYSNMSYNLSMAIKEHLKNYNSNEIAVVVIGFEEKEVLNIAIDQDKLSSVKWIWITQ